MEEVLTMKKWCAECWAVNGKFCEYYQRDRAEVWEKFCAKRGEQAGERAEVRFKELK